MCPTPPAPGILTGAEKIKKSPACILESCGNSFLSVCKLCSACMKINEVKFPETVSSAGIGVGPFSLEPHSCNVPPVLLSTKQVVGRILKS